MANSIPFNVSYGKSEPNAVLLALRISQILQATDTSGARALHVLPARPGIRYYSAFCNFNFVARTTGAPLPRWEIIRTAMWVRNGIMRICKYIGTTSQNPDGYIRQAQSQYFTTGGESRRVIASSDAIPALCFLSFHAAATRLCG
jgi:hypothetical protein